MEILNGYDDTSTKIKWRNINNQRINDIQIRQQRLIDTLCDKFGGILFKSLNRSQIRFILIDIYPEIQVTATISFNKKFGQLSVQSQLIKNGISLKVKSKALTIMMCRYFNKFNSTLKYGNHKINPLSGQISYKFCSLFSGAQIQQYILDQTKAIKYVQEQLRTIIDHIKYNSYKVLILMAEVTYNLQKFLTYRKFDFRKIEDKVWQQLQKIQRAIAISHVDQQFMWYQTTKKIFRKTQEQIRIIKQNSQKYLETVSNSEYQPDQIVEYLYRIDCQKQINFAEFQYFMSDICTSFAKNLAIPTARANNGENIFIFQKINVNATQGIKWQALDQGGFTVIQKSKIYFNYMLLNQGDLQTLSIKNASDFMRTNRRRITDQRNTNLNSPMNKIVVRKLQYNDGDQEQENKILHQKQILTNLFYDTCMHVNKFYFSQQPQLRDCLIMDYFPLLSLQHYRKSNIIMLSLLTKLYLLSQCCQALRFLHDRQITHFDIKPLNFLMGKGMYLRITDFGQAYHPKVCEPDYKPGFTLPYSPPQVFKTENIQFSEKNDVFSFGVMMYEIIFGNLPIHVHKSNKKKIQKLFSTGQYINKFKLLPQRIQKYGPSQLIKSLCLLISKCVQPNPNDRPYLDWILIILKQSITYVDMWY